MKLKQGLKITKGMVFAGCSFTWGQGLYYYSGMDKLREPLPNTYNSELVNLTHERYMKSVRFPRLVSNYFNTFEICQPFNGGASYSIHEWWRKSFLPKEDPEKYRSNFRNPVPSIDYSEVSHLFYQITQWHRSHSEFKFNDKLISHCDAWETPGFIDWLNEQGINLEEYENLSRKKEIQDVKDFLREFDSHGIKVYILSWPADMVNDILSDEWLASRFIRFDYKGNQYNSMEEMMETRTLNDGSFANPELTIANDTEYFDECPKDNHPSLTLHKVIADNIIRYLEKEK